MSDDSVADLLHRRPRMADVARFAGVSPKSVSRVINNERNVTEALRTRVQNAITALDYVPDTAARSLAGARSFTIGLLFDNPSPNYTIKVQTGAYRACVENGYHLRIDHLDSTQGDGAVRHQLARLLNHSRIDGFVLTPPLTDNPVVLDYLEARRQRYSRIAPVIDPGRSAAVFIDDASAASEIAQLLWDRGHRKVGLVNGPESHGASAARRTGFLDRFCALGPGHAVIELPGDFSFAGGMGAGRELVALPEPPSAIFAVNDDMAAGVMVSCGERGLVVPRDISVVGFDDSLIATSVWPYLATVYQPIEEMAFVAASFLFARDHDGARPAIRLDYQVIERASLGARGA